MNINLTLIGQMIVFVIFVIFTRKYVWAPIITALEARKAKIADGLASAEKGKHELELAENRVVETLKESKIKAQEFITQAQKRADEIIDEAKTTANVERERILSAAQAQADQEMNEAKESLRKDVGVLAIAGAEQILMREVDASAHKDVLDKLGSQL